MSKARKSDTASSGYGDGIKANPSYKERLAMNATKDKVEELEQRSRDRERLTKQESARLGRLLDADHERIANTVQFMADERARRRALQQW